MKNISLLLWFALLGIQFSFAQDTLAGNVHKVWVYNEPGQLLVKGFLYEMKDSSITVAPSVITERDSLIYIEIKNIHKLKIRKRWRPGRLILAGTLGGFTGGAVTGTVLALGSGNGSDAVAVWGGFMGGVGTFMGGVISLGVAFNRKKIRIKKNQESYEVKKGKLAKYLPKFIISEAQYEG